jgi:hypothetical protein
VMNAEAVERHSSGGVSADHQSVLRAEST